MKPLPRALEELRGKKAARWLRESTAGQYDNFGPDAQREQQDRAIERYGLLDTGVAWEVAHSGRTIATTTQWVEMLASAGDRWDILVVGYVSRFARDARTALNARHDLHAAGAAVLFADEQLLTSDEDRWIEWYRETGEAEAYSRKLGKRIREGYAAKRRRLADPGGHPPFGFRRSGPDHVLEVDPELADKIYKTYNLAATRLTDREVAERTGIPLYTVRGMLRNPLYAGRLPDGTSTRFPPLVDVELWNLVQEVRDRRSTRDGRPAKRRPYALSMLRCGACGRRLIGDTGRYRHLEACPAFRAAAVPAKRRRRGQHAEPVGRSYAAEVYEDAVRLVLGRVSLGADLMAEVVTGLVATPEPDRLALVRINRERAAAMDRYGRDRDTAALEAAMQRLDLATLEARVERPPIDAGEAVAYLRDLPRLWDDAPNARRALAEALFERIDVLGIKSIDITPSSWAVARGLAEAFRTGSPGYGRGERTGGSASPLIARLVPGVETRIRIVLPAPAPLRILRSA